MTKLSAQFQRPIYLLYREEAIDIPFNRHVNIHPNFIKMEKLLRTMVDCVFKWSAHPKMDCQTKFLSTVMKQTSSTYSNQCPSYILL